MKKSSKNSSFRRFSTLEGSECQSDAEQLQAFTACQLTLVVLVAVVVNVTRIDLNTSDVMRERRSPATYIFLLEGLMNAFEIVLQVHLQRDLLRCQTPDQTYHFLHVLILQERALRDGVVYAMGDQRCCYLLFDRHGHVLLLADDVHVGQRNGGHDA